MILYFQNAYYSIYLEIHPVTKGVVSIYDVIIVLPRHVETVVLIEKNELKSKGLEVFNLILCVFYSFELRV